MKYKYLLICIIALINTASFAQLTDFYLDVVKTEETCFGNATLTCNTANTNPLASLRYAVYKYPNLTVPVSVQNTNHIGNLGAGDYKVIVTQILNPFSNFQEKDITINHVDSPIDYDIISGNTNCSQRGQISINVNLGIATGYEIISGPVVIPRQPSNIFTNLPAGTYNIRIFNECNVGEVTTYTLVLNTVSLEISDPQYSTATATNCSMLTVQNTISAPEGSSINYPIQVEYTINIPNGNPPHVITHTITSGNIQDLEVSHDFEIFPNDYNYSIKITDNCNSVYTKAGMIFSVKPEVSVSDEDIPPCGKKYLTLSVSNFKAPLTINFINPGFDVSVYNTQHPGPFNNGSIAYGSNTNPFPEGVYTIQVTDACGRTGVGIGEIKYNRPEPTVRGTNNGCFSEFGRISIQLSGRDIVSATIIIAPSVYTPGTPHDVSASIINGRLTLNNMPVGMYKIKFTDECGIDYIEDVEVPPFVERRFTVLSTPHCNAGHGAVRVRSLNGRLTQMSIVAAPAGITVPMDVSANIDSAGDCYITNLPAGNYTFQGEDACGIQRSVNALVDGYRPDTTPFTFLPNCGAFDIELSDVVPLDDATYWLQKRNPVTGAWGHPENGAQYTEGNVPDNINSIELQNNRTSYNFMFSGEFRLIKNFSSYADGAATANCIDLLGEFSYDMGLKIRSAYKLSCNGHPNDVYIDAVNGLQPYTYRIVSKDGLPFTLNNGNNPIFANLAPAIYDFEVEDACGNFAPSTLNIRLLPSLVDAAMPNDMVVCTDTSVLTGYEYDLHTQDAAILHGQSPALYTVTYHLSLADANNGNNPLPDIIRNTMNHQVVYARVVHNLISICHETVNFKLQVGRQPVVTMPVQHYVCEQGSVTLTADAGFDKYEWSTGQITRSITVNTPGIYTVKVTDITNNVPCSTTVDVKVDQSSVATITEVHTEDWTVTNNTITVITSGYGNYQYSLDGIHYQDSNVFYGLPIGLYKIYVKDRFGCGIKDDEVVLLNYPKFFTPNGDGTNEKWRIKFSQFEPGLMVYIFDRYGKLITGFDSQAPGWDGTLNGKPLPSTDYWFVVERQSGRVYKGHFSMIR